MQTCHAVCTLEVLAANEKSLTCALLISRQQYRQEAKRIPTFARLYEVLPIFVWFMGA